jgi:hypothetical protein
MERKNSSVKPKRMAMTNTAIPVSKSSRLRSEFWAIATFGSTNGKEATKTGGYGGLSFVRGNAHVLTCGKGQGTQAQYRIAIVTLICVKMELEYVRDGTTMPEIAVCQTEMHTGQAMDPLPSCIETLRVLAQTKDPNRVV